MFRHRTAVQTTDHSARNSIVIGLAGAILTGWIHYGITSSSHFDFLVVDREYLLVIGAVLLVIVLSLADLKEGLYASRHMNAPHKRTARTLTIIGLVLGVADLIPAAIILMIVIETLFLRFFLFKSVFEL